MAELPSGTVTFLFSDVEGSTQLLERHGSAMGSALARHQELFEQIVERHGGGIFETVGDAVYAAFGNAGAAAAAAVDAQRALADEDWGPIGRLAVRIAIHTGSVERAVITTSARRCSGWLGSRPWDTANRRSCPVSQLA